MGIFKVTAMDSITNKLFNTIPCEINKKRIERQLLHLSNKIDRIDVSTKRHEILCAQFRALNWALRPDAFSSPISDDIY